MTLSPIHIIRSTTHRQRGQSAVEMALLLPLILMLIVGVVMTGFMLFAFIQVSNAAREGARAGSIYRLTAYDSKLTLAETVQHAIYDTGTGESALGYLSPTAPAFNVNSDVTISLVDPGGASADQADPQPGDQLTVNIKYHYTLPVLSAMLPVFPQPVVIDRTVVMEIQ